MRGGVAHPRRHASCVETMLTGCDVMNDEDRQRADELLGHIELAAGEIADRDGPNAVLIASILQAVNGLRSLLSVVRSH
jgi:hypothetical protein